jgi:SIR2-like domain
VRRPVPDSAPQGGWPSLKGGLHYIKLHGSATWKTASGRRDFVVGGGKTGLIDRSPLLSWYRDIFRAVCLDGGVKLIVIGYGFQDDHINDVLIEGVTSHHLTLYVVGHGSHKDFHGKFDRRLLEGLRGYVNTPLAEILGDGSGDTPAMTEIRQFLDG